MIRKLIFYIFLLFITVSFSYADTIHSNAQTITEISGELEVVHIDNFKHPENSTFIFYLISNDDKRYRLEYEIQPPIILSGTPVIIKGNLSANKILVEKLTLKDNGREFVLLKPTSISSQNAEKTKTLFGETTEQEKNAKKTDLTTVLSIIFLVVFIIMIFLYVFYKKKRK